MPRRSAAFPERLARCVFGLALFGVGIALIVDADLGLGPWDVFHQGLSEITGLSMGLVIVIVGVLLMLFWIPLRQRPGLGTVLNALEIGVVVDLAAPLLGVQTEPVVRLGLLGAGLVLIAAGSGLYIGAGLGAGPRDGLMMGLAERGVSVRSARTGIELVVLAAGIALGGAVGVGTIAFAFGIGPMVQVFLPLFDARGDVDGATAEAFGSADQ